jgi:gamma-glutamyltranspeptidase/glutathione hydrolase
MVTSPHHLASEAGLRVLREGGNAIEATLAMAASLPVVYPHMNSIGGDGFWLISKDGKRRLPSMAGAAAQAATVDFYRTKGFQRSRRAVRWPRTQSQARCRAGPK